MDDTPANPVTDLFNNLNPILDPDSDAPDPVSKDWPDSNSDSDQDWHPKGPYDPVFDVDSPLFNSALFFAARDKEEKEEGTYYTYANNTEAYLLQDQFAQRAAKLRHAYHGVFYKRYGKVDHEDHSDDFYDKWA